MNERTNERTVGHLLKKNQCRASLADVVAVEEEARDPRYITLTVKEPSAFLLPFKRAHTWRLYSENRLVVEWGDGDSTPPRPSV